MVGFWFFFCPHFNDIIAKSCDLTGRQRRVRLHRSHLCRRRIVTLQIKYTFKCITIANAPAIFWFSLLQIFHYHWLQYPDLAPDSEGNTNHRSRLTLCPMTAPPCHFHALIKSRYNARSYCGDLCSLHEDMRK